MMNERIRELAEQAGIAVWGDAVYMYDPKDTLDSTVMEKFAELIVRECLSKVDASHPLEERSEWGQNSFAEETIKRKIKTHFRVEE